MSDETRTMIVKWFIGQGLWAVLFCTGMYWFVQVGIPMHLAAIESGYVKVSTVHTEAVKSLTENQTQRMKDITATFEREQTATRQANTEMLQTIREAYGKPRITAGGP